jgi:hypothetical protein
MSSDDVTPRNRPLNARVGAVALAAGGFLTLVLTHTAASLAPMRLVSVALSAFAAWCFSDEMGMHKPLNRAAFVCFVIAISAKAQVICGVAPEVAGRYLLVFSAFVLLAMLFWSVAFLHRQRTLKIVGAVGVVAAVAPIVALVVGHLVVGVGAVLGIRELLEAGRRAAPADYTFVALAERVFGLWAYAAAWMLWRGETRLPAPSESAASS